MSALVVGFLYYAVSQKNDTDVAQYTFDADQPIFGRGVAEKVCYQMVICYPTSCVMSLYYLGKHEPRTLSFQPCCILCLENKKWLGEK